jgi:hypothetical protein
MISLNFMSIIPGQRAFYKSIKTGEVGGFGA